MCIDVPAATIHEEPRVYRSQRGAGTRVEVPPSANGKSALMKEVAETYAQIESRTTTHGGAGSHRWWIGRHWAVVQFNSTPSTPGERGRVVLARMSKEWLRQPVETSGLADSVMRCAETARIQLSSEDVQRTLRQAGRSVG